MARDIEPGRVFWFTGLSGVGKTTLCRLFVGRLREQGRAVVMFDGDALRALLGAGAAYARAERLELARRYSRLCQTIAAEGVDVAIATISLFREVHDWNRANIPGYFEILLTAPEAELARRDTKKLYARAARGELSDVVGVDQDFDLPSSPHFHFPYDPRVSPEETAERLAAALVAPTT